MKAHVIILVIMAAAFIPEVISLIRLLRRSIAETDLPRITQRYNYLVFITGFVMMAVAILYDVNYLKYKPPIKYDDWQSIKWSDFRAIKRPSQTLYGSQTFAFITSEIKYDINNSSVEVQTLFHPARSYTYSEEQAGDDLMQHELYHLHITELFSRQIRKKIANLDKPPHKYEIVELIEVLKKKEREYQRLYDDESFHGYVLGKQRFWQNKVDSSLNTLDQYINPIIEFEDDIK